MQPPDARFPRTGASAVLSSRRHDAGKPGRVAWIVVEGFLGARQAPMDPHHEPDAVPEALRRKERNTWQRKLPDP